jgi:hypothetical protein
MIPSLLGNIVGGALFTQVLYWYLYLARVEVTILFDAEPPDCQRARGYVQYSGQDLICSSSNTVVS